MTWNKEKIDNETYWNKKFLEKLKKKINDFEVDSKNDYRLKIQECKTCFYLKNGIAGQAFTSYICKHCNEQDLYPNTNIPKLCKNCASELNVCRNCGAILD